jgi:hypothetical protein
MSNIPIWPGSSSFAQVSASYANGVWPPPTPFGFYDNDSQFQTDANKVANFCALRLGYPIENVELQDINFWAGFEEATTIYGNELYAFQTRDNYLSLEGASTSLNVNNSVFTPTMATIVRLSQQYGEEAGAGGNVNWLKGRLPLIPGQQRYDLAKWAEDEGIVGGIEIKNVYYQAPPAIMRYFDPYAGTGTGIQSLMDAFDFGSYSPGVNFLLMPISYDMLKVQAIEFNDQVRKSAFSFEIVNNTLKLFPVPKSPGHIWFEYYKVSEKQSLDDSANTPGGIGGSISNISNVPYENPTYGNINSIGKQWVYKYALALAKELLAYVRGKYTTVPVPGSEATLNQQDLLADARTEKAALIENLRAILEGTSKLAQLERKAGEGNFLQDTLKQVPMVLYVG